MNTVVRRLRPAPEFIVFPGDEIMGLTAGPDDLRAQWRHWLERETAWLDRSTIPVWHTTGNHTAYDTMSEAVFRETLHHLPRNGPPGQEGLAYWVRREDLLLVFIHTLWTGLGGEGHVETDWLRGVLAKHADARHKFVVGHHPVHPVNGFSGPYQREVGPEHASTLWRLFVEHDVFAYICSHILAFDVQVHDGVLQICTAGAGTAHRMPEGVEYLHCVQAALDGQGLRYQVLDTDGRVRERLSWPLALRPRAQWRALPAAEGAAPFLGEANADRIVAFRFTGRAAPRGRSALQTLLTAYRPDERAPLWIGLTGPEQRLTVVMGPEPGRSPHYWHGPAVPPARPFDLDLVLHAGMGPGGVMSRSGDSGRWSTLAAASPSGTERLVWPERWSVGRGQRGAEDRVFLGEALTAWAVEEP